MATYNRNLYRIQELVSAGEIGGLLTTLRPLHSVTFDGTPVAKQDGQLNFKGATITERTGTEDQAPVSGFESISITESVGVELEDTQEWVTRQISSGFSRVRVFLRYPNGLFRFSSKGKYQSWDMRYDIEVSTDNSGWTPVVEVRSSHRTQQSFDRVHVVSNPTPDGESTFYVRCRRARAGGNERETGTLFWHANAQLESSRQSYPDTAYYSIEFDAQQLGNVLPARGYHIRGIRCLVPTTYEPTLYDPLTGEITQHASYSSTVWDGSFKLEHCTDAAWIGYNMLVNEKWGAGKSIDANLIDVFSFWEASKYNVELIDNGIDDPHPRFVFNGRIADIKDMRAHCDEVLATCQASTYEEDGLIRCYQDHPTVPSKIFVPANVVGGMVERQSNSLEGRLTVCEVTFNDRTDRFEPTTEVVEVDESLIDAYGYRIANIAQNGVTERPQAIRAARWQIENSHIEGSSATLSVGWENWDTRIGDVVYILDDVLNPDAVSGRILAVDGFSITLDRVVGRNITNERMIVQTSAGLLEVVANAAQGSQVVTVSVEIDANRLDAFVISDDINQYRVVGYSVAQGEKTLVCGSHDPTKYARIEVGEDYTPEYPPLDPEDILPPTQLTAFGNISDGIPAVYIDWAAPVSPDDPTLPDTRVANYVLEWDGPVGRDEVSVHDSSYQIDPADLGDYEFTVTAYTTGGTPSPSVSYSLSFAPDGSSELLPPTAISGTFDSKDVYLTWIENPINANNPRYVTDVYILRIGDDVSYTSRTVEIPFVAGQTSYKFQYNFDDNVEDHREPVREVFFSLSVRDNLELESTNVTNSFENTAPEMLVQLVTPGFSTIMVELRPQAGNILETDVAGFIVEINGDERDLGMSATTTFPASVGETYEVRSAAYDVFGKVDLNWSPMVEVTPIEIDMPDMPTIPDFSRVEYRFSGLVWTLDPDSGEMSWNDHSVQQLTWNDDEEIYESEDIAIEAGILAFGGDSPYVVLDWDNSTYIHSNFDGWFNDGVYLMGQVVGQEAPFEWADEGVDKLAVNAISTRHLQADAVRANNIKADEKIVIGNDSNDGQLIILDGTAEESDDPMLWMGGVTDDGDDAVVVILKNGNIVSVGNIRSDGNLEVHGSSTIGGSTNLEGDTVVGAGVDNFLQSGTYTQGAVGWKLFGDGNLEANNGTFRGTLDGVDGNFVGTVYAENISGDIVHMQSFNVGSGILSQSYSSIGTVTFTPQSYARIAQISGVVFIAHAAASAGTQRQCRVSAVAGAGTPAANDPYGTCNAPQWGDANNRTTVGASMFSIPVPAGVSSITLFARTVFAATTASVQSSTSGNGGANVIIGRV